MKCKSFGGTSLKLVAGLALFAAAGVGIYFFQSRDAAAQPAEQTVNGVTTQARKELYANAMKEGEKSAATWPKTEQEVITEFWKAASEGNLDRAILYVPGASKKDFAMMEKYRPSPVKQIGNPETNPNSPGVTMWPTTVPYPNFPNKTVKMAVMKLPDGRFVIDGKNTIWW
ncbi:MAG: hypothetical protein ABI579_03475 [Candidatus Sumerlaeota bacterium]